MHVFAASVAVDRGKLTGEQQARIHTQNQPRALGVHTPEVVAIAATDIQYTAVLQRANVGEHAIPLPVRAPLGVNLDIEHLIRAFAPGHQPPQSVSQVALFVIAERRVVPHGDCTLIGQHGVLARLG